MTPSTPDTCAAFVGIDWAEATHDVCLQAAGAAQRACFQLEHTPETIDAWGTTLRTRFNGQLVAVCHALNKGPLVYALRTYDVLLLFPLNPLTLARYRDAFTPSQAKDDPTDAALQLALLLTHRDTLPPRKPHSPTLPALAPLVLGTGLFPAATRQGQSPPGRRTRAGVQVDPHALAVLAGAYPVQ